MLFVKVIVMACLAVLGTSQRCLTSREGPRNGANKPCAFPFEFQGRLRNSCITDLDPDGRLWCSTKTDQSNKHVGGQGHWGYCPKNCEMGCRTDPECPQDRACQNGDCVNPCVVDNPCGTNADCLVSVHLAQCRCRFGYTGDPYQACRR